MTWLCSSALGQVVCHRACHLTLPINSGTLAVVVGVYIYRIGTQKSRGHRDFGRKAGTSPPFEKPYGQVWNQIYVATFILTVVLPKSALRSTYVL